MFNSVDSQQVQVTFDIFPRGDYLLVPYNSKLKISCVSVQAGEALEPQWTPMTNGARM